VPADESTRGFSIGIAALVKDLSVGDEGIGDEPKDWAGSASDLARAARLRQELAVAKARAEHFEDACQLAEGAVRIYRRLSRRELTRYQPEMATTLTAWGLWSSRLGRREHAVAALSEAVTLHRELLQRAGSLRPMRRLRLRVGLAVALSNLGSARSELGEHDAATFAAEEAVRVLRALRSDSPLYRLFARQDPLNFERCLACALNNLGVILAERGHQVRAWELTEETAELYRRLAAEAPVLFEAELARVLHNLGMTAAEIGRTAVALSATREAVYLHRSLLRTERADYRQHLGRALCSFARVRAAYGTELAEALAAAEEAVLVHEQLTEQRPQAFSGDLHVAYRTASSVRAALARRPVGQPEPLGQPGPDSPDDRAPS
jgi:tetratricopeptide (TPR) repeat protein